MCALSLIAAQRGYARQFTVKQDHPDGIYTTRDTVRWTVQWKGLAPAPPATYSIK